MTSETAHPPSQELHMLSLPSVFPSCPSRFPSWLHSSFLDPCFSRLPPLFPSVYFLFYLFINVSCISASFCYTKLLLIFKKVSNFSVSPVYCPIISENFLCILKKIFQIVTNSKCLEARKTCVMKCETAISIFHNFPKVIYPLIL